VILLWSGAGRVLKGHCLRFGYGSFLKAIAELQKCPLAGAAFKVLNNRGSMLIKTLQTLLNPLFKQFTRQLLALLLISSLVFGLSACGESASGLTGSYADDTIAVAEALLTTISTPAEGPERANQQREARSLINSYVALYRPNSSVNGLASFTTMQTALNSLAGHYASYANRPLPEALVKRIDKELHQAEISVTRGS